MDVAPVFAVAVFQDGQQLEQRSQPVVVFKPVMFVDLLQESQIVLVQDAPVLVADFGGGPFDVDAFNFCHAAPASAANGRAHDACHFSEDTAAVGDRIFESLPVDQLGIHSEEGKASHGIVPFGQVAFGFQRGVEVDVGQENRLVADGIEFLAVEQSTGDRVHDGAVRLHHDFAPVMEDGPGDIQVGLVHVVDQDERNAFFTDVDGGGNAVDDRDQPGDVFLEYLTQFHSVWQVRVSFSCRR